jgi:hypothetical protein
VLECTNCSTLNSNVEAVCLSCGSPLRSAEAVTGVSGAEGRCPAGHPVDPTWKSCPYCDRQAEGTAAAGGRATRLDGGGPPAKTRLEPAAAPRGPAGTRLAGEAPPPEPARAAGPVRTRLEEPQSPRGPRTVLHEAGAAEPSPQQVAAAPTSAPAPGATGAPHSAPAEARRLVAVLAAPEAGSGGAVFAVRSGRNTLGSGHDNDIVLAGDGEVSRDHAVILHRKAVFHLADRLSTNGTWINGGEVPANGTVPLEDRDRIRVGRTELVFLRIDPSETPAGD